MSIISQIRFDSGYTMSDPQNGGNFEIYPDTLSLALTDDLSITRLVGTADTNANGEHMVIDLIDRPDSAGRHHGNWREVTAEGGVNHEGEVEFVYDKRDNRLYGYWSTRLPGSEELADAGTWVLVQRLGDMALSR